VERAPRLDDYTLEAELGRGTTGVVYRATSRDGRLVAIKLFDQALARDEEYRARLAREARVAREIRDPHLVQILEAGAAEGRPFLALEYVAGGSLAEKLLGGPLPLEETLRVVSEVAAGLDALHRGGIVHRDVKPSNVMLRDDGSAALTDFGLAKGTAYTVLTRPGQVVGTLDYLAPEVIRGGEATPASDVYALGCVTFECLAGAPPFADRSLFGVGRAHLEDQPPDPPASPELAWALLRALEKDPAERPGTAMTYAHLLRAAMRS
jgi:serine/threonine protein kinase